MATSDASIKFHEVWSQGGVGGGKGRSVQGSVLTSQILEGDLEMERQNVIR